MITDVAYVAMHSSPLIQPGSGDAGGMNVYLDRLSRTMAARGINITTFTRRTSVINPTVVDVAERYRVVHIEAGPLGLMSLVDMKPHAPKFASGVIDWIDENEASFDLVHSHYWLSGRTGVRVKDRYSIPLANSFHTLGKVKDRTRAPNEVGSSSERLLTEAEVIKQSDCVIASTPYEFEDLLEHYGASPERLCVNPPGVDHDVFKPGERSFARSQLGLGDGPIILYAGRIQAHKGTAVAVEAYALLRSQLDPKLGMPRLLIVGGASGEDGTAELERCRTIARRSGVSDGVDLIDPVSHDILAKYYRAADLVIVPSRSESFGLVAAEAQACGTPVVAANIGGLAYVVSSSESGLLVDHNVPEAYCTAMKAILEHPGFAKRLSDGAVAFSQRFSWDTTASRLLELYGGITDQGT
ncbi:MAG: glycosyltransferase [Armatimonadetes bacterium]|nr:MAG: glycosyltransferase [Armatimonadota bacterium]